MTSKTDSDKLSKGIKAIKGVLHGRWADHIAHNPDIAAAYKYAFDLISQLDPVAASIAGSAASDADVASPANVVSFKPVAKHSWGNGSHYVGGTLTDRGHKSAALVA